MDEFLPQFQFYKSLLLGFHLCNQIEERTESLISHCKLSSCSMGVFLRSADKSRLIQARNRNLAAELGEQHQCPASPVVNGGSCCNGGGGVNGVGGAGTSPVSNSEWCGKKDAKRKCWSYNNLEAQKSTILLKLLLAFKV